MTDAELSKQLALALGYYPESVRIDTDARGKFPPICKVYRITNAMGPYWRHFDYRNPSVVVPLIKWLVTEHEAQIDSDATMFWVRTSRYTYKFVNADTLEAAVARAVIAVGRG